MLEECGSGQVGTESKSWQNTDIYKSGALLEK